MTDLECFRQPARVHQRQGQADVGVARRMSSRTCLVALAWLVVLALSPTTHARATPVSARESLPSGSSISAPPQHVRNGSPAHAGAHQLSNSRTAAVCTPKIVGWSLVENATLDGIGYLAAAIPVSRYILVLGGIAYVRDSVDAYTYLTRHTKRRVNLVNPRTYAVHTPLELIQNTSSTVCPDRAGCIEPVHTDSSGSSGGSSANGGGGLVTASLLVPVVGAGSVVQVGGRVYAFGACNTVPDAVNLDLLRAPSHNGNDGIDAVDGSEDVTPTPSPEAQTVEDYLRSVLRIRPFQKKFAERDAHVVHQDVRYQPPTMALRFNATCVSGANGIVYLIGGVNARTGDTLASVAQYDTKTDTFVEGVWSLDSPVMTAAATSDNGLMFIAGGFSEVPDPSLLDPYRTRREYHTSVAVVDAHRDLYDATVAKYATSGIAEKNLQWTAPHLFAHGARLFMLGSASDASAYRRLAYWQDMSGAASQLSRRDRARSQLGAARRGAPSVAAGLARSPSSSSSSSNRTSTPSDGAAVVIDEDIFFDLGTFAFAPSRQDAALAMVPVLEAPRRNSTCEKGGGESEQQESDGSRTVRLFLLGGRLPPAAGGDAYAAEQQIFSATVTLCERSSSSNSRSAVMAGIRAEAVNDTGVVEDRPVPSLAVPRVLGFSYTRVMHPATAMSTVPISGAPQLGSSDDEHIPNQDGNTTVYVNGHEPLWYNYSFSVLLPLQETAAACPGVLSLASAAAASTSGSSSSAGSYDPSFSTCSLMLSSSPHCDAALAEFHYLSPRNTRRVRVPVTNLAAGAAAAKAATPAYTDAIAVGRTLLIGSLEGGLAHVFYSGADGRHKDGAVSETQSGAGLRVAQHSPPLMRREVKASDATPSAPPSDPTFGNTLYYEQRFVYVCFSAAPSAVAHCGTSSLQGTKETNATDVSPGTSAAATVRGVAPTPASVSGGYARNASSARLAHVLQLDDTAACSSRFYIPLNPCKALVLSPVMTWTPHHRGDDDDDNGDSSGDDVDSRSDSAARPTPSPVPPPPPPLRSWLQVTICVVLLVLFFSAVPGSFVLMRKRALLKGHRGGDAGGQRGVGGCGQDGTTDDGGDQQCSLLRYHEAPVSLFGGGGGVGGGLGIGGGAAVPGLGGAVERLRHDEGRDACGNARGAAGAAAGGGLPALSNLSLDGGSWDGHDGPAAASPQRLLDGKYEVIRKLGKGSFSVVYLVRRISDSKRFALKYVQCSDDLDRHEAMKECEVVYALQGHPNVIQLFDMFMSYRFDRHMVTVPGSRVAARQPERRIGQVDDGRQESTPATPVADGDSSASLSEGGATPTAQLNPTRDIAGAEANPVDPQHATTAAGAAAAETPEDAALSTPSDWSNASVSGRAVVYMDSAYLDAMTAGVLRNSDASNGPTTHGQDRNGGGAHGGGRHVLQAERYLSLVMAYHECGDLARWVRQRRALQPYIPEATVVSIGFQVLSLLAYMHHRHHPPIIHRDLKPENILLTSHVHYEDVNEFFLPIVVTDFGLSRVMDKTFCESGVGSLPYLAPECWRRRYSTKVDIWALGCVLYAVCSKRVDSSTVKVMFSECMQPDFHERLRDEVVHVYGYSPALAWFITALLAVKPDDRPTAAEALSMLRRPATNTAGELVSDGRPLACLLRAAPPADLSFPDSSASREPLRCTDAVTASPPPAAAAAAAASSAAVAAAAPEASSGRWW